MTTPEPRTLGHCPACGAVMTSGHLALNPGCRGVVPAPDVEAGHIAALWEAFGGALRDEAARAYTNEFTAETDYVLSTYRPLIEAALRGSGARPEPEHVLNGAWCSIHKTYEDQVVGARPEEGLRAAARAILPEVINEELPSAITSEDPMVGLERIKAIGDRWDALRAALSSEVGAIPDYLAAKDASMAEHSDTRSACPQCGEWRDSPSADCANCGWVGAIPEEVGRG